MTLEQLLDIDRPDGNSDSKNDDKSDNDDDNDDEDDELETLYPSSGGIHRVLVDRSRAPWAIQWLGMFECMLCVCVCVCVCVCIMRCVYVFNY